jgi:hypothetical protein
MLGSPPELGDRWSDGVCRQTSEESCSAAAAATLLHTYGIAADERQMARLCLTSERGTLAAGVWRGLRIVGGPHRLGPRTFHGSVEDLRAAGGPVLINVGLRRGQSADPRYQAEWGWTPGVSHSVILFRFVDDSHIEIGDPDVGWEVWSVDSLRVLWHGDGILLRR